MRLFSHFLTTAYPTTATTRKRKQDKQQLKLAEQGNNRARFYSHKDILLAVNYVRVVFGDRGPYIEFLREHIWWAQWKPILHKHVDVWYDECYPVDGSNCKLYVQKRTVAYADYRIGRYYISPDQVYWRINDLT